MKELSIEEKAKRYDEAIEVAQRFYNNSVAITKKGLEDIFPELMESEDERIMKAIIEIVKKDEERIGTNAHLKIIQWIEKQVEKDEEILILKDQIESLHAAIKALKEVHKIELEKQGEQNPTWSEEDEKCIENAIMYCEWARDIAPNLHCYEISEKSINWLKSIKDRVQPQTTWKPSDEQLECLGYAIEKAEKDWSPLTNNRIYLTLKALKEQLLELRGSKV